MGLDWVDTVLRIEQAFQVQIAREDEERIAEVGTVGALYQWIVGQLGPLDEPGCLGARVFYRLRDALVNAFDVPADAVAPSSELEAVVPEEARRQNWRRLAQSLDLALPSLRRPPWLSRSLAYGALAPLAAGAAAALRNNPANDPVPFLLLLVFATGLKAGAAHALTVPLAVRVPDSCRTVKGFIKTLLRSHYGLLARREGVWHPVEVWHVLQDILVESLGVKLEDVTADAHLTRDLGAA